VPSEEIKGFAMKIRFPRLRPQQPSPLEHERDAEHVPLGQAFAALERAYQKKERERLEVRYGPAASWPRLSETLTGPRHPHLCQSCGKEQVTPVEELVIPEELFTGGPDRFRAITQLIERESSPAPGIYAWQEHDEDDQPEPIIVMLCTDCSDRLVGPHPRLYSRLTRNEPCAGIMPLCLECAFRAGVRCTNPEAGMNGGPGLEFDHDPPLSGHISYGIGRGGAFYTIYPNPVRACSGRQPVPGESAVR
jgi:hypothetical protein